MPTTMDPIAPTAFASYLQHLSDHDLGILTAATGDPPDSVRHHPEQLEPLLAAPASFEALFGPERDTELFVGASPFLVFAVTIERGRRDLEGATYVPEWLGPNRRIPVLGTAELSEFLADSWRRLFLAQLLASYTHVASGTVFVATHRGYRRQRFSELDPVRLAALLDVVTEAERPGIYRRLGDLALFLTGIFPDHTATSGFGSVAESRLLRAGRLSPGAVDDPGAVELLELLGQRWYRLAASAVPTPRPHDVNVIAELSDRFAQARRVLNMITDRYLWPARDGWFGRPS